MYLNRILNNFMFSYKGKLPNVFLFAHPVGTVLGNADYGEYLVISQDVTINTCKDENGAFAPQIGKGLFWDQGQRLLEAKRLEIGFPFQLIPLCIIKKSQMIV